MAKSAIEPGGYYILTCECGEPVCRQLYTPIKVKHCNDYVSWHIKQPLPERIINFKTVQLQETVHGLLKTSLYILDSYKRKLENGDWRIIPFYENWNEKELKMLYNKLRRQLPQPDKYRRKFYKEIIG